MTDVIWSILTDNWQYGCSIILLFALGYLYAYRNYRWKLRDLERENDRLRGDNEMLCRILRKRGGDNEVSK